MGKHWFGVMRGVSFQVRNEMQNSSSLKKYGEGESEK